ncbi:hypothetical protein WJX75_006871 [Coccomyxa subellipsoidea]|uniref:Uncharacterized protein n=1 Tax=Coccomyxa subellipsoidea TaxID=248742 RepID=A0ABR2Z468_9CHLO
MSDFPYLEKVVIEGQNVTDRKAADPKLLYTLTGGVHVPAASQGPASTGAGSKFRWRLHPNVDKPSHQAHDTMDQREDA